MHKLLSFLVFAEAEINSTALIGSLVTFTLIVALISVLTIMLILLLIRRKRRIEREKNDDVFRSVPCILILYYFFLKTIVIQNDEGQINTVS